MLGNTFQTIPQFVAAYWPIVLCSFLTALVMTPVCRAFARRRNIVDRPDDFLKPHKRPIPYLGGVAIFFGWAAGILVALALGQVPVRVPIALGVLLCGGLIMGVGLFDDLRMMSPRTKLALTMGVGVLLLALGLGREVFRVFVDATVLWRDPSAHWVALYFSIPFALFIVVGACNATNLIDGLDGLCGGVLGIIALGFVVLALHLARWTPDQPVAHERIVLSLAMAGAAAGFLPYNRNPATIFMGDAGSMLLGLNAAVLILMFCDIGNVRWMLGAITVFGLPIADMMLTLVRRWRNARPLMIGDRSHFYDQLVDRGYTVRQVVMISYVLAFAFAAVGCVTAMFVRTRYALLIYAAVVALVLYAVHRFHMVDLLPPEQRGHDSPPPKGSGADA